MGIARELGALVVRWWRSPPWCRATSLSILSFTQFALAAEVSATELNVALDSPRPAGRRSHAPTHLRVGTNVTPRSTTRGMEVVATQTAATAATLRATTATLSPRARVIARELGALVVRWWRSPPWCRATSLAQGPSERLARFSALLTASTPSPFHPLDLTAHR